MNIKPVLGILGYLLLILAGCLVAPLGISLVYDSGCPYETSEIIALSITLLIAATAAIYLLVKFRFYSRELGRREGYLLVAGAWVAVSLVGMLPYLLSGLLGLSDAFFEAVSGLTTTGASVFGGEGRRVEAIPHGIQFWRHMTQWLGGVGIIVISVALLSFLGVGGYHLVRAEVPGGIVFERDRPRMVEVARGLWHFYLLITAVMVVLLWLAGMNLFDAACHAFSAISTGGFSTRDQSAAAFSPLIQWLLVIFMFMAGTNFSLIEQLLRGRWRLVVNNAEWRLYCYTMLGAVVLGIFFTPYPGSLEHHLRQVIFQVVSITTTTGYASEDYEQWPAVMKIILFALMFVGGCMGSTGGSIKPARILVFAKMVFRELHRMVYPHGVRPIRVGQRVLETQVVSNILAFGFAYVVLFAFGTLVMGLSGYDFTASISASAACLGNIGPGLGAVGPSANWAHLPALTKWIMSFLMLFGRMEIFTFLILLTPWAWKK